MLGNIWYDDISLTFPIMPPGIKLCDQQSFRPSNVMEMLLIWLLKCPGATYINGQVQEVAAGLALGQ
jgi:hypothetical protein